MVRRGRYLHPASRIDEDEMGDIPQKVALRVLVSRKPSSKMKAWYRALLSRLVEATGMWPTPEQAHRQLLIRCGYMESMVISTDGDVRVSPVSTADWDGSSWRFYINDLLILLTTEILPGVTRRALVGEVERMIGIQLEEAMRE